MAMKELDFEVAEEYRQIIVDCNWRIDMAGVSICRDCVLPCLAVISKGECDTLIKYFQQKGNNDV